MDAWWTQVEGPALAQGDLLSDCVVPILPPDFQPPLGDFGGPYEFDGQLFDVIVVTQCCDLENDRAPLVATCPLFPLSSYEEQRPAVARRGRLGTSPSG